MLGNWLQIIGNCERSRRFQYFMYCNHCYSWEKCQILATKIADAHNRLYYDFWSMNTFAYIYLKSIFLRVVFRIQFETTGLCFWLVFFCSVANYIRFLLATVCIVQMPALLLFYVINGVSDMRIYLLWCLLDYLSDKLAG